MGADGRAGRRRERCARGGAGARGRASRPLLGVMRRACDVARRSAGRVDRLGATFLSATRRRLPPTRRRIAASARRAAAGASSRRLPRLTMSSSAALDQPTPVKTCVRWRQSSARRPAMALRRPPESLRSSDRRAALPHGRAEPRQGGAAPPRSHAAAALPCRRAPMPPRRPPPRLAPPRLIAGTKRPQRLRRAIRLEVSQRAPPMLWTSA